MHDKAKKDQSNELFRQYKMLCNKIGDQIRKAKQDYFSGEICNNANPQKMWTAIIHVYSQVHYVISFEVAVNF